ncbi:MAG: hypothetical protein CR972_03010 [Candidatus Moraniibacteriota bacterium]|nr:MAG: hypothetical protein CR972_03010 [Candidatus Moranbacteria bacterium]
MIKAVLFDMNGVIIDDEHIHEKAFQKTVKKYGINVSHNDYLSCCAGKTDRKGYEDISTFFNIDLNIDELLKEKSQMYLELFPENKKSYDGVIELIKDLAKIYTIALTSSSSRSEIDLITKELGIINNFATTISADDVKNGKPNPEPYLKTAQILGINPENCVAIEDSASGVQSAKDAGCYCIAITTTHSKKDLYNADVIVDKFSQINQTLIEKIEKK